MHVYNISTYSLMKNQYIFQGKELLHKLSYLLRVYTSQNLLFYTIYHYGQNLFNHKYFDPRVNIFDLPRCKVVYY